MGGATDVEAIVSSVLEGRGATKVYWVESPQWPQITEYQATENHSQTLKLNGICSVQLQTCSRLVAPFYFPIFLFWNENIYPIPISHCILETNNYLVSQVHKWRSILPQDLTESDPYLI